MIKSARKRHKQHSNTELVLGNLKLENWNWAVSSLYSPVFHSLDLPMQHILQLLMLISHDQILGDKELSASVSVFKPLSKATILACYATYPMLSEVSSLPHCVKTLTGKALERSEADTQMSGRDLVKTIENKVSRLQGDFPMLSCNTSLLKV